VEILVDLSKPALVNAIKLNLYTFFRYFQHSRLAEYSHDGVLSRWYTKVPHPWFNGVLSAVSPNKDSEQEVAQQIAYFQSKGVENFTWWLQPEVEETGWEDVLRSGGLHFTEDPPGMAVDLTLLADEDSRHTSLQVLRVEDQANLQVWGRVFGEGFEIPESMWQPILALLSDLGLQDPVRHYLGYLDGKPVATSTMFFGAGVAGIYNVATLPSARGRGAGSYLTRLPLLDARKIGYRAGILQSSEMGYGVYRRLGFEHLCDVGHYFWKEADD